MPLTLSQFNLLSTNENAKYFWANGVEIAERMKYKMKIVLYQVDSFYVEVYYDDKANKI
jgi:hypothetical protein